MAFHHRFSLIFLLGMGWIAPVGAERPPPDARRVSAIRSLGDLLDQTAALAEGTVVDISHSYSDEEGPHTLYTLDRVKTHLGEGLPQQLSIRIKGGPLPDERFLQITHQPVLAQGKRYLLFLRNTEWHLSPLVTDPLMIEQAGGKEVLLDLDGHVIQGVQADGLARGPAAGELEVDLTRKGAILTIKKLDLEKTKKAVSSAQLVERIKTEVAGRGRGGLSGHFYDLPILPPRPFNSGGK